LPATLTITALTPITFLGWAVLAMRAGLTGSR
jgi:hypothetical protein